MPALAEEELHLLLGDDVAVGEVEAGDAASEPAARGLALLLVVGGEPDLASLGAVSVPRATYVALLASALGGGVDGAMSSGGAASSPPDFFALDALLEVTGAGAAGPVGYVISQLLGHTS